MTDKNPCDCCERRNLASGCSHCALDLGETTCTNSECFLNVEDSCMIGIADTCKASPEFEDNRWFHGCDECVYSYTDDNYTWRCDKHDGEKIGMWYEACEDFKERKA